MASEAAATGQPAARQPLLMFKRLEPIEPSRHGGLRLDRDGRTYRFAEHANAVPLTVPEFAVTASDYPIVFTDGPTPMPLALLGYRQDESLFVEPDGSWAAGFYVPWYIRCYPFAVLNGREPGSLVPCLDAEADGLGPLVGELLLENEAPSPMLKEILNFCHGYNRALEETRALGKALHSAGLLLPHEAVIALGGDRKSARVGGFWAVDKQKFQNLPDKTFLAWRKNGFLAAVYQHLQSLNCWPTLSAAASRKLERRAG
jgi:SapC